MKWPKPRDEKMARPGAAEALERARIESAEDIRLYELRHSEAHSQVTLAGRLELSQSAVPRFENLEDVRVPTLRHYLEALGARLEVVAVFDSEDRRVPIQPGKDDAA